MGIRKASDLPSREISEPGLYLRRREFLRDAALASAAVALVPGIACGSDAPRGTPIPNVKPCLLYTSPSPRDRS